MNELPVLRRILLVSLAMLAAACSPQGKEEPPLAGAAIGGPFTLTDQDGRRVSDSAFAGKYRLVYFGFTYCPDVCPTDLQVAAQALRALEKSDPAAAAKVQPIFISVDPQRDTPPVIKEYVAAFHSRLIGLTGSEAEIKAVAKNYGVYFARQGDAKSENYLVDHSRALTLFGPKGEPVALIPTDQGVEGAAAELRRWVV